MAHPIIRLDVAHARVTEYLECAQDSYVPLAVAAAITFHQVHGDTRAIISRRDYNDALDIAAAALSCLIPIYTLKDPCEGHVPLAVDLTRMRFARGATLLCCKDGTSFGRLSITRAALLNAISAIKRAGLPFSFAVMSLGAAAEEESRSAAVPP